MPHKKKKDKIFRGLVSTGFVFTGSSLALGSLPTNPVTPHVQSGLARGSSFFPTQFELAGLKKTIDISGNVIKSTRELGKTKRKKSKRRKK